MVADEIITFRKKLKSKLDPMRYEHSLSVSYLCIALAMRYGADLYQAELAGLLHDCAKWYAEPVLIQKCQKHGVLLTEEERQAPAVIHAKYGAWVAAHKYGIVNEEILSAIRYHSTGRPDMSLLEKIVYVADYIEPRRDKAPDLPQVRPTAFENLDRALFMIMESSLSYLEKKKGVIDPMTKQAYEYYSNVLNSR